MRIARARASRSFAGGNWWIRWWWARVMCWSIFRRRAGAAGSRGEEDAAGASRAYLVDYAAEDVINWSLDEQGNYEWVVIRTKSIKKDRVEDEDWRTETRWAYYDKTSYRIYKQTRDGTIETHVLTGGA